MNIKSKRFTELSHDEQTAIIKLIETDFPAAKALFNTYQSRTNTVIKPYKTNN